MKCPKCNEEIIDGIKFCTKCGANIAEEKQRIADEESKKQEEAEKKRKAVEDKKRLEEIRKQEQIKRDKEIKEAEKQEAIRQAKEEGIELEIIDEKPQAEEKDTSDFKFKKDQQKEKKKKQKVKIKKNIFQRILNKIIFMLIVASIIIGGVYYCYTQEMLPEFAQKEVQEFETRLKNVIRLYKEVNDKDDEKSKENTVKNEEKEESEKEEIEKENITNETKTTEDKTTNDENTNQTNNVDGGKTAGETNQAN